jgi:hypothetical protein
MLPRYEIAAGTVQGASHRRAGKNSQDAFGWALSDEGLIAVVCDGCSSGRHSEVGAQLGARLLLNALYRELPLRDEDPSLWQRLQENVLSSLRIVAELLGGELDAAARDYLLFTVVGVLITPRTSWIFVLGDGVVFVNEQRVALGPYADNAPPYLAYRLFEATHPTKSVELLPLCQLPTSELRSVLIGTDGVCDLIDAKERTIPGSKEVVGPIEALWQNDGLFKGQDACRRRLARLNRDVMRRDRLSGKLCHEGGLLPDDTTLLIIRRANDVRE